MTDEIEGRLAQVVPTGRVYFLRGVTLDASYQNTFSTRFLQNVSSQASFFMTKEKMHFDKVTPIRLQSVIRVPVVADDIIDCNYMMFQNSSTHTKWYYAFITQIDWISIAECHVHYELDVIQTNLFDIEFKECFVLREHMSGDKVGANLYPDNIELGEYRIVGEYTSEVAGTSNDWSIVIACIYDYAGNLVSGNKYAGMYSGVQYNKFDTYGEANSYIDMLNADNKQDGIISVYMCPKRVSTESVTNTKFSVPKKLDYGMNYAPAFMKLYTSPYNFLYVSNNQGQGAAYQYEYFDSETCDFMIFSDCTPSMTYILVPQHYKGVSSNWNERLELNVNVPCTYNTDYYKAWLAQHNTEMGVKNLSMVASAVTMAGGAISGNPMATLGGAASLTSGITDRVVQLSQAKAQPDQAHGATASPSYFSLRKFEFTAYQMQVTEQFCSIINGVWKATGYPINRIKVPSTTTFSRYNYTKTQNATVAGNVCLQHRQRIEQAMNEGITWWHGDFIGQYNI